jgi:hypothetical protein
VNAERWCLWTVVSVCLAGVPLWAMRVCVLALSSRAFAAQITLSWDTNNDPAVAGYIIYYGSASGQYKRAIDVGTQLSRTLTDLEDGKPTISPSPPTTWMGMRASSRRKSGMIVRCSMPKRNKREIASSRARRATPMRAAASIRRWRRYQMPGGKRPGVRPGRERSQSGRAAGGCRS